MATKCPKCQSENPPGTIYCGQCATKLDAASPYSFTMTLETPVDDLPRGTLFGGRYEIIEALGEGGMGKVYRAFDTRIKEEVAIKLLRPEILADRKVIERFSNELKFARQITHKNVCRTHDMHEEGKTLFITMEYVRGEDLKSLIRRTRQLAPGTAVSIAVGICKGLAEAHKLGLVHRDLKPHNIMIDNEGTAKIMDFGIARSVAAKGITGAGMMIGTPEYMSPEQVEGTEVDQRSDIYSLGIILYEMLTGRVPFEGDTPFTVAVKQKSAIPKDPAELNAQIPGALSRLILRCLEKDKETRYRSADELRADLEKIENGASTSDRPVAKRKTVAFKPITVTITRNKLLIPALAVALIAIAAVIWFVVLKRTTPLLPEQKRSIAVISFENQTGDKNYDYLSRAIPDILITRLEQSGLMSVTTWDRLQDLLKQAQKPDVQFINKDLGLELCRLDGAEVLAQGSFIKTGDMFAINVRLYDVAANRLLKTTSSSGQGETSILKTQIDELSKAIAKGAGVSSRQLATDTAKAAEMMTSSPEAYKWYLMGREEFYRLDFPTALRYLEKAAEIDPDLAMAQRFLSLTYRNLGRSAESRQALEKAYKLSGKIGEKDRLLIESDYAGSVENDRPKRLKILEDLVKKYPKERTIYLELGETLFFEKGEYDKAISLFDKALALFPDDSYTMNTMSGPLAAIGRPDLAIERLKSFLARVPDDANNYDTLGLMYILSGDLDQAIASFNDALAIRPDLLGSVERSVYPFALKEDYQEVLSRLDRIIGVIQVPLDQFRACLYKAFFLFWLGSPTKALSALDAADKLADEFKLPTNYRLYVPFLRSWLDLEGGEIEKGRQEAEKMREIDRTELGNNPSLEAQWKAQGELGLAFAELKAGRLESAKKRLESGKIILEKIESLFYRNQVGHQLSIVSAELYLEEGRAESAASSFDRLAPYEFFPVPLWGYLIARLHLPSQQDIKARAYVQMKEFDKAISEYERLVTFDPKSRERFLIHPLYHYRLAKLYQQKGIKDRAKGQYERFLDLWKGADPGRLEVDDAKKRLMALT